MPRLPDSVTLRIEIRHRDADIGGRGMELRLRLADIGAAAGELGGEARSAPSAAPAGLASARQFGRSAFGVSPSSSEAR